MDNNKMQGLTAPIIIEPIENSPVIPLPDEWSTTITIQHMREHLFFGDKSMVSLFVRSAINLETEINRVVEKQRCVDTGEKFRAKNVNTGKLNPQAFVVIGALKMFIEQYSMFYGSDMLNYINTYLADHKEDLLFAGINVKFDASEANKMRQIIDALCITFYENMIYAITVFLSTKGKAFIMNTAANGYIFRFRNFNIMETVDLTNGKIPFNLRE